MNKILFFFSIIIVIAGFSSCKDFLDEQPESAIGTQNYFLNDDEVESGVIACYDGLQEQYDETYSYVLMEIRSDNTTTVEHEGDYNLIDQCKDTPNNSVTTEYWRSCYNTIFRANTVLENIDNCTNANRKSQYEGEALFIRALTYFNLVRLFGEVPLVDKIVYEGDNEAYSKKPVDLVYDLIISDLTSAANLLPKEYGAVDLGRATSGAAKGLLAKVHLTLHDYPSSKALLEEITGTSYSYGLMDNYYDIFYDNEMNKEILFAVRYESAAGNEGQSFSYEMTRLGGVIRGNNPTSDLLSSYEDGDLRYDVSVTDDLMCGKYLSTASQHDAGNDWIVLRYADVLLMYAEVVNEISGPTQSVVDVLNGIRTRAGLSSLSLSGYDKGSLRNVIYHERRIELAMESHRWFDLIRTGTVDEVMTAHSASEGFNYETKRQLFPIPQREIDVSSGFLTQNPDFN